MLEKIKRYFTAGLFMTIGSFKINVPVDPKWSDVAELFDDAKDIINWVIGSSTVVAVIMIVVAGYTFITSSGNPDKVEQAQKTLTGSVIGLIIVWVAGMTIKWILELIGYEG